uniref:HSA domain-containing protein n=1 Tax=Parastrongyloides trichosuri TaxID=131310 RepID=A0A0N4ZRC8_PARTI
MTLPEIENDEQLYEAFKRRREKLEKIRKVKKIHQYFREKFNNYIRESYARTRKELLEGKHPKAVKVLDYCERKKERSLYQVDALTKLKEDALKRKQEAENGTIKKRHEKELLDVAQQEMDKLDREKTVLMNMAKSLQMHDILTVFDEDADQNILTNSEFKNVKPTIKAEISTNLDVRPNNLPFVGSSSTHFLTEISGFAHISEDFARGLEEDIKMMKAHMETKKLNA